MRDRRSQNDTVSVGHILHNLGYSFRFIWKYSRGYLFLSVLWLLIGAVFSPLGLLLTDRLFLMLEEHAPFGDALTVIGIMMASAYGYVLLAILWENILTPRFSQSVHLRVQSGFFEKVRRMELAKYDDPEFYNDFVLTMQNADSYATSALDAVRNTLSNVLQIGTTVAILADIDLVAVLIMVVSAVLAALISRKQNRVNFQRQIEGMPIGRRKEYIDRVYKRAEYAKELRLTDLGDQLIRDYDKNTEEYTAFVKKYGKKASLLDFLSQANNRSVYLAIVAWTVYRMMAIGSVTLGGFAVVVTSCTMFKGALVGFFNQFTGLAQQSMYMDRVRAFMEYQPKERQGTLPAPRFESIELKHVSFGYRADTPVLRDISFRLSRGEKIAVVGYNGAGKSTLIKLLMHLYEPTEGSILYNGRDFGEYELDSYRSHIGAVFQDYKIFAATVGENVLGDLCTEADRERVERALGQATFDDKLATLSDGIDTVLTREFDEDGTNLSGGEAQKIAIARVFARDCDLIIMDEPSAALDPIAEYTLNRHIAEYAADKAVIFISHRLSTTRHADRIYMLENGRIIEAGPHDELMAQDGQYAHMFRVQAEKYIVSAK